MLSLVGVSLSGIYHSINNENDECMTLDSITALKTMNLYQLPIEEQQFYKQFLMRYWLEVVRKIYEGRADERPWWNKNDYLDSCFR